MVGISSIRHRRSTTRQRVNSGQFQRRELVLALVSWERLDRLEKKHRIWQVKLQRETDLTTQQDDAAAGPCQCQASWPGGERDGARRRIANIATPPI